MACTTAYEIVNNGSQTVPALKSTPDGSTTLAVIGQSLNYYDGSAFKGLDFGEVGDYGAVVRTETLLLTEKILLDAYGAVPSYLVPNVLPAWSPEYPQASLGVV